MAIIIDMGALGILLFCCLALGADASLTLTSIILEYQWVVVVILLIIAILANFMFWLSGTIKGIILGLCSTIGDALLQIGFLIVLFTMLEGFSSDLESHFLGMIFLFIPAILETLIFSGLALAGCSIVPFYLNEKIYEYLIEDNKVGISIILLFIKFLWIPIFLSICKFVVMSHWPNAFSNVFSDSFFNSLLSFLTF